MAYENYSQVSWTDGSPLTGERLQQMSTNIEQVKEATDDSPQGLKKIKSNPDQVGSISSFSSTTEIIALKDEFSTGGNADNRVTIDANRYYRITLHFTGFQIDAKGAEDSFYQISLHEGTHGGANTTLHTVSFTPPIFAFINVATLASQATIANIALRSDAYDSRFGAGTYSVVKQTGSSASTNKSYFAAVTRFAGASPAYAPSYIIPTSATAPLQLFVEDIGGIA